MLRVTPNARAEPAEPVPARPNDRADLLQIITIADVHLRRSVLVLAATFAGAAGMTLLALGWWVQDWQHISDWTDPTGWWGGLIRGAGILLFGKLGFKLALGAIVVVIGLVAWVRSPRSKTVPGPTQ